MISVRYGPSSSNPRRTGDGDTEPPYNFQTPDLQRILATTPLESRVPGDFLTSLQSTSTTVDGGGALPSNADLLRLGASIDQGRSPSRRRRRRRRTSSESSCCDEAKNNVVLDPVVAVTQPATEDWTQVGANLRQIADDYYASVGKVSLDFLRTLAHPSQYVFCLHGTLLLEIITFILVFA